MPGERQHIYVKQAKLMLMWPCRAERAPQHSLPFKLHVPLESGRLYIRQ